MLYNLIERTFNDFPSANNINMLSIEMLR